MQTKERNPVKRIITSKDALIKRLNREIEFVREEAETKVKGIQFRIKMAQTLLDALKKGL